ncbi:MAG TPA: hypothetical protein VGG97_10405 [Bryobacteraceae bacterium]|jgi:hypothetical protein
MTVEAIKSAIEELKEPERHELLAWLDEFEAQGWDEQMEKDFSPGGRGHHLVDKINRQIDAGLATPLEPGLLLLSKKR